MGALEPGERVGNFEVERQLGQGGFGEVYLASHLTLDRKVAIKVTREDVEPDGSLARRFIAEARAVSRIGHPGVVEVFDFGTLPDGRLYSVMEALEGHDLEREVRGAGRLSPRRASEIGVSVARILEAVHDRGVVHRDLKPGNIFLERDSSGAERVRLLDFGFAILKGGAEGRLTAEGYVVGTPYYMSPEQAQGEPVDARTDVYALGCVLYELLSGRPPFHGDGVDLLVAHVQDRPVPIDVHVPGLPPLLAEVVMRCLEKEVDCRIPDMGEVALALSAVLRGAEHRLPPARRPDLAGTPTVRLRGARPAQRRTRTLAFGAAGLATGLLLAYALLQSPVLR